MHRDAVARARRRLADGALDAPKAADLEAALERARAGLETLARTAAELEATVPERVGAAIEDGMRAEVLPVARHIAEVRGLTGQIVRRLEALQREVAAERKERVEDLALVVDLGASGWLGAEARLDRLERAIDRLERTLEARPGAPVYRIEGLGA
jgi:hypothetical protein